MKQSLRIFFILVPYALFAQKVLVTDAKTGKPVKEVTVYNASGTTTAVTNDKGLVTITGFKQKELIYFSHVSYAEFQSEKFVLQINDYQVCLSKESEKLDEVVLSVFKNKAKVNRIAEQIAVVPLQDIQRISPQTSADLLATIPGIKVQKSQFGGGSPVLRGMESNRVLLVVDGVRMNNAIYRKGHLQNSITVSPNLLDRTEVVFGPSSVTYGSDALGGVIHYYTKTPRVSEKPKVETTVFSRYSSVNTETTTNVAAEVRFPKWASFTSISHSNYEDLKMGTNRSHGFTNWGKVPFYSKNSAEQYYSSPSRNTNDHLQRNTGFHQTDVLQKLYVPLSNNTDVKLNVQYATSSDISRFDRLTELKDENDLSSLKFAEWYYGPQERLLISPQLEINPQKKWLQEGTITLAYQNIKESRMQRKFGSLNRSYRKEEVDVYSVNGDFSMLTARNRKLGYGFEVVYNDVASTAYGKELAIVNNTIVGFSDDFMVQSRYPDGGSSYLSSALYLDYRQDISRNSTLNTGVRVTNTQLSATWNDETFIQLPTNDIHLQNTAATFTLGYVYKPTKTWQLNTVLSSGFRSPNVDDVGKVREKNGNVTVPNVNLKPEHAYNAEIGVQKYSKNRKFRVGFNAYYTLLRNYIYREAFPLNGNATIVYDGEAGATVGNVNKGNAYVTGFTASYQGKIHKNWKTSGFVTYTKGETYDTQEPMSSIPPLFGNFELSYIANVLEFGANTRFNARKKMATYNITEGIDNHEQTPILKTDSEDAMTKYYGSPSWMTIGLYGKYKITTNVTFQGAITNLLDVHYKEFASGISAPGRNFSLSLFANF